MSAWREVSTIRAGTYLGECFVHCNETITITADKTRYELTSNVRDSENPDIAAEEPTPREEWERLRKLVDWERFQALPRTIGQPDRSDQGGEWIELTCEGAAKRVDFEMNAQAGEIDALVRQLRDLRQQLSQKHRR